MDKPEFATLSTWRPCQTDRQARDLIKKLLPEKCRLHTEYIVPTFEWRMHADYDGGQKDFRQYITRSMALSMGELILDEKPEAFTESFDFDRGQTFRGDAVVFSPQEWREFEDKITEALTKVRYVLNDN